MGANDNLENKISPLEKQLLDRAGNNGLDEENLSRSELDNSDADGELLNERSSESEISGSDLDVPGSELDDSEEAIGEEDEENNSYSEADTE